MIISANLVLAVLETITYESGLTITGFPCSVTIRESLANTLVDIGFIELVGGTYKITDLGTQFLNNSKKIDKI